MYIQLIFQFLNTFGYFLTCKRNRIFMVCVSVQVTNVMVADVNQTNTVPNPEGGRGQS